MKKALITGVAGQDGSYLSEFLLQKGYEVHGTIRRSSLEGVSRVDHLYKGEGKNKHFNVHYGDITDSICMSDIISKVKHRDTFRAFKETLKIFTKSVMESKCKLDKQTMLASILFVERGLN